MFNKKQARQRRSKATRARISRLGVTRLAVHRSNTHIYATIFDGAGERVLASASSVEAEVRAQLQGHGGNVGAAQIVGRRIAEKARAAGIEQVAFDRGGFQYHGRVKALAEAAREAGLKF